MRHKMLFNHPLSSVATYKKTARQAIKRLVHAQMIQPVLEQQVEITPIGSPILAGFLLCL